MLVHSLNLFCMHLQVCDCVMMLICLLSACFSPQVPLEQRSKSQLARELKAVELQNNQLKALLEAAKQEVLLSATGSPAATTTTTTETLAANPVLMGTVMDPCFGAIPVGGDVANAPFGTGRRPFGATPMGGAVAAAAARDVATTVGRRRNSAPPLWGRAATWQG